MFLLCLMLPHFYPDLFSFSFGPLLFFPSVSALSFCFVSLSFPTLVCDSEYVSSDGVALVSLLFLTVAVTEAERV